MVTNAIFLPIGVVGVADGTYRQVAVISAALVFVRITSAIGVPVVCPSNTLRNFNGIRLCR